MDRVAQEEIFGPVLSVIRVNGYEEAAMAVNSTRYGLSSSIFTRDTNTAFRAMRDFTTGIVYVNAGTIGAETHLPFGGMKQTGNGHREAGHVGARHVHRVEVDIRRLLRQAPASADRQPMNAAEPPDRYFLSTAQRHALWENEMAMFIVLAMPLVIAAFWYGATIEVIDFQGRIAVPAAFSRGIGLAALITFSVVVGGMMYLFVQPAADRVRNAHPIRGHRRVAFAGFVGLLVGINTFQSLTDVRPQDGIVNGLIAAGLAVAATLIAFVAMHSMVDIPKRARDCLCRIRLGEGRTLTALAAAP